MTSAIVESTLPEFVKVATAAQLTGTDSDPAAVFADSARRRFYTGTKAGVWVSAEQISKTAGVSEHILQNIKRAAKVHGISAEVDQILGQAKQAAAVELPDECYALTLETADGPKRAYRIASGAEVKTAAAFLLENRNHFTGEQQQKFANAVLRQAATFDVQLQSTVTEPLTQLAGQGEYLQEFLKRAIQTRIAMSDAEYKEPLEKLASATDRRLNVQERLKVAAWLTDFDQAAGLANRYGRGLQSPERLLFGISKESMEKVLNSHVQLSTGTVFEKSELHKVAAEDLRATLGDEIGDQVTNLFNVDINKLAAVLPELPPTVARRFEQYMATV